MAWLSSTSLLTSPEICVCQRGQGQPHAFWKQGQMSQGLVPHSVPWTRVLALLAVPKTDRSPTLMELAFKLREMIINKITKIFSMLGSNKFMEYK